MNEKNHCGKRDKKKDIIADIILLESEFNIGGKFKEFFYFS